MNVLCFPAVITTLPPNTASISKRKAIELTTDDISKSGFAETDFSGSSSFLSTNGSLIQVANVK